MNEWDKRYLDGGNSGRGSYGYHAEGKAQYINNVIDTYNIKSINDLGHGDGNQLTYFQGDFKYYGYDISTIINDRLKEQYEGNDKYTFVSSLDQMTKCDLALSLDVLYHIIDLDQWEYYLNKLFTLGKYVVIYAVDLQLNVAQYFKARPFTQYIQDNFNSYTLIDVKDGFEKNVKFYLYQSK